MRKPTKTVPSEQLHGGTGKVFVRTKYEQELGALRGDPLFFPTRHEGLHQQRQRPFSGVESRSDLDDGLVYAAIVACRPRSRGD